MENPIISIVSSGGLDPADIVGEFTSGGNFCRIVKVKGAIGVDLKPGTGSFGSEICRFEINGQMCAIVQTTGQPLSSGRSCLATLLTTREQQIATLVALGCPNKLIAHKLHISEWTVATYLRRIFAKLGVETRAAMTYRCASLIEKRESGIIPD